MLQPTVGIVVHLYVSDLFPDEAQGVEACAVCFYHRVCIMIFEEAWRNAVNAVAIITKSFLMSIFR